MSVGESIDFQIMEHSLEDLQKLGSFQIVKKSINIPRSSSKTFFLLTLTLVFPISHGIRAHNVIASYLFNYLTNASAAASPDQNSSTASSRMCLVVAYQFIYVIFLFTFSLLSTGAIVFTVASLYTSKPTSFSSLRAIPLAFQRLFVTFFYISLLIFFFHLLFFSILIFLVVLLVMHPHI